jgi:hypothetical protein
VALVTEAETIDRVDASADTAAVEAVSETIDHLEKCTKLLAQNAARNVKFRSNQLKASLYIAGSVLRNASHVTDG